MQFATTPTSTTPSLKEYLSLKGTELGKRIQKSESTFYIYAGVSIVVSALFIATASVGINVYNSCIDFGTSGDRVSGMRVFFIIMLVIAILVFLAAIAGLIVYMKYFRTVPSLA